MPINLYPSVAKAKRNGAWQNLPGFVQQSGDADIEAMIANKETSTTAQFAHVKDSFFILNDILYQADENISINGTIAVGTNCHVAVLGDVVSELIGEVDLQSEKIDELSNYVTPEMFGAKGDGVTDDTIAIQNAIDSGLPIYFHNKSYKINNTITITKPVIIKGSSSQRLETNRCNLDFSAITGNAIVIKTSGVVIEDLNFLGVRSNTICFDIENYYRITINRCGFYNFNKGIYTNIAWNIGLNNCIFEFCNTCLDLHGVNTSWSIVGTNFYSSTKGIASETELDYSALFSCGFDTCDTCIELGNSNANNLALIGCGFENYITGIYCIGNSYCTLVNPLFLNTSRSVETYKGLGKIIVIGGRTDWELTPNKSDVLHIGTWNNSNAKLMGNIISFNQPYLMPINVGQICDYIYPITNGYTMHINYETATTFDVEISVCSTDYPETVHFTKESSTIAKTQGTFTTFTYNIDRENNKVDITFTKGGNIRVRGWFKAGGSIT